MKTQDVLKHRSLFTAAQAKEFGMSAAAVNYYIRKGELVRVKRGVYKSNFYEPPKSFQWHDLIEASYAIPSSCICLVSALAIYEYTEEIPREHWLAIPHGHSQVKVPGYKIMRFRQANLGKITMNIQGSPVNIYDRERTIVDAFRMFSKETALKALKIALKKTGKQKMVYLLMVL